MNSLIVITGQTATGKTKLAINYAKRHDGELISADSRQVYKHLDIITGKDLKDLHKNKIKAHLLDLVTPNEPFSSFDFVQKATIAIADIQQRKKTPIIVGGTYLYIKHLLYGQDVKIPPNADLRNDLEKKSVSKLQNILLQLFNQLKSQNTLNQSDWNNPRRLVRKIEILTSQVGQNKGSTSEVGRSHSSEVKFGKSQIIGLKHKNKESLIKAITARVEKRLEQGAIEEVKALLKKGYKKNDHGLQTIGYKQLIAHLAGDITLEQARQDWINKEVRYAKRQNTFMKTDLNISWKTV